MKLPSINQELVDMTKEQYKEGKIDTNLFETKMEAYFSEDRPEKIHNSEIINLEYVLVLQENIVVLFNQDYIKRGDWFVRNS